MTSRNAVHRTSLVWIAVAALLISPVRARAARVIASRLPATTFLQDPQDAQEKEQERRERQEEAREREQEKIERLEIHLPRPSERVETFTGLPVDRYITIVEGAGIK